MIDLKVNVVTNTFLIKIGAFLLLGLILTQIESFFYRKFQSKFTKTSHIWDKALIYAIHRPLQVFIWLMMFSLIIPALIHHFGLNGGVDKYINPFCTILSIVIFLWFSLRFINNIETEINLRPISGKIIQDKTTIRAISQLSRVAIILMCILIGFQTFGISITTLLTVGGIGGIALGFAAKDTLANFLGGMMIFWDRPFSVGDWIRSPDSQLEGVVEHIGWRLTRIRTADKRPLYVPNGLFSTILIENPGRMSHRRIRPTIGLRYQDAPKLLPILKDIEKMLYDHPDIDNTQAGMVNLLELGPYSLNFFIETFTKKVGAQEFQAVQEDILLKVFNIIEKHEAACAFPTTTLNIPTNIQQYSLNVFDKK